MTPPTISSTRCIVTSAENISAVIRTFAANSALFNSPNRPRCHGFNVHNSLFAQLLQRRWFVGDRCNVQNNTWGGRDYSFSAPESETVRFALSNGFMMSHQVPLQHAWLAREAHPDV